MTRSVETALTPSDMVRMLLKHKRKVLFCMLCTAVATIAAIVFWPRAYASDAALFVRLGRESVALDPTATVGDTIPVVTSREVEINTALRVLRSRVLAEKVVDLLGPGTILARSAEPSGSPGRFAWLSPSLDPISDRERAVHHLVSKCEAKAERNSDVITISYQAETPALAQQILATLIDAYLDEHVRLYHTPDSHAFFAEQAGLARQELVAAAEELREAKNEAGLISIEGQKKILLDEMGAIETDLLRTRPLLAAAEQRVTILRRTTENLPSRIATDEVGGHPNQAADTMRSQLYEVQKQEAELASKFVGSYPLLEATRRQVKLLQETLAEQEPQRTQHTTTLNPVHQQLEKDLLTEEAAAGSLQAEIGSLCEQQALLQERFEALNAQEGNIAELERKVELLATNHRTYSVKLEQSRIEKALGGERITNVNVVQPASFVAKPVTPNKTMLLAIGMVAAVLLGYSIAALAECLERREETPKEEMERRISLTVPVPVSKASQRHAAPDLARSERRWEVAPASNSPAYAGSEAGTSQE